MPTVKGTLAWFWPTLLLILLAVLGGGLELAMVLLLVLAQLAVFVYRIGHLRGKLRQLRSDS
jgi:hypothetical protein